METVIAALVALAGTMTLVQLAPVKINPWSWVAKAIGRAINAEVIERVGKMEKDIDNLRKTSEEHEARSARVRILRFGDEILHGVRHSQEHFHQVLLDVTEYEEYCGRHPEFKNNVTCITTKRIKETYEKCLSQNQFL